MNNKEASDFGTVLLYGEIVVLGTNGKLPNGDLERTVHKYKVYQRHKANGIKTSSNPPSKLKNINQSLIYCNDQCYSVGYQLNKKQAVVVEYEHDEETDMFQIGRSTDSHIDMRVMDLELLKKGIVNEPLGIEKSESTISRFACRILVERKPPHTARIYAAGFNTRKNIFLGERAVVWAKDRKPDGITTNGVLVFHPRSHLWPSEEVQPVLGSDRDYVPLSDVAKELRNDHGCKDTADDFSQGWCEVSICGDLFPMSRARGMPKRSHLMNESNILRDGTLIDICGVTLIWREAGGLSKTANEQCIVHMAEEINNAKVQCPVLYRTLAIPLPHFYNNNDTVNGNVGGGVIELVRPRAGEHFVPYSIYASDDLNAKDATTTTTSTSKVNSNPKTDEEYDNNQKMMVYMTCGHVHGEHGWDPKINVSAGVHQNNLNKSNNIDKTDRTCPLCMRTGLFRDIVLGQEPSFYVDRELATHCFTPCGHLASENTVEYWYYVNRPNRYDHILNARCPFCNVLLLNKPLKLIFP